MGKVEFGIGYLTTSARASPTRTVRKKALSENRLASFIYFSPLSRLAAAGGLDVLGGHRHAVRICQKHPPIIYHPRNPVVPPAPPQSPPFAVALGPRPHR